MTDILSVCAAGDHQKLREVLEEDDTLLETKSGDGKSLLEIACTFGRKEVVEELIQSGADVTSVSERGYSLAHWAAAWGHMDVLKYLLQAGVDLISTNVHGESPHDIADRYLQTDCSIFLEKEEAMIKLKQKALCYKEIINDPEKNLGRFNKDDKTTGNKSCDEKLIWLEQNRETANIDSLKVKSEELEEQVKLIMAKLKD